MLTEKVLGNYWVIILRYVFICSQITQVNFDLGRLVS